MLKYKQKILALIILVIFYTIIYSFLDNTHFEGINPVKDKLKEEKVEEKKDELIGKIGDYGREYYENNQVLLEKKNLEKTTEKEVDDEKEKLERPSILQHIFDRFYFSMITACLLGYGDIHPSTNILKLIVASQSFITLCLILY